MIFTIFDTNIIALVSVLLDMYRDVNLLFFISVGIKKYSVDCPLQHNQF